PGRGDEPSGSLGRAVWVGTEVPGTGDNRGSQIRVEALAAHLQRVLTQEHLRHAPRHVQHPERAVRLSDRVLGYRDRETGVERARGRGGRVGEARPVPEVPRPERALYARLLAGNQVLGGLLAGVLDHVPGRAADVRPVHRESRRLAQKTALGEFLRQAGRLCLRGVLRVTRGIANPACWVAGQRFPGDSVLPPAIA